jgi:hypothetical protein
VSGSKYSELELQYARPLATGLIEDPSFRAWLLAGTHYGQLAAEARHDADLQRRTRARPAMTNPYWFNYWCGKDRDCDCRIGTAIETDILLIFEAADGERFAVHVEVKRPNEQLGVGQAITYPRRAACWANSATRPSRVPDHSGFVTVLACGSNLAGNPEIGHFDKTVFHDAIAEHLHGYPKP